MVKPEGQYQHNNATSLAIKTPARAALPRQKTCYFGNIIYLYPFGAHKAPPTDICQPGDHASKPHTFTSRKTMRISTRTRRYKYLYVQRTHRPAQLRGPRFRAKSKTPTSSWTLSALTKTIPTDICQPGDHASKPLTPSCQGKR